MKPWEQKIIAQCLGGDAAAQEHLYATHANRVRAYLLRSGFSSHDAEDLTQDVFMRAFKSLHTFDLQRGRFHTWLGTIARNVARKRWQRRQPTNDSFDPQLAEEVFASEEDELDDPARREELDSLGLCIQSLPEELGAMVKMRYVESLTTRGMAERLEMPESTVRLRLDEAKGLLLQCMRKKGFLG